MRRMTEAFSPHFLVFQALQSWLGKVVHIMLPTTLFWGDAFAHDTIYLVVTIGLAEHQNGKYSFVALPTKFRLPQRVFVV